MPCSVPYRAVLGVNIWHFGFGVTSGHFGSVRYGVGHHFCHLKTYTAILRVRCPVRGGDITLYCKSVPLLRARTAKMTLDAHTISFGSLVVAKIARRVALSPELCPETI